MTDKDVIKVFMLIWDYLDESQRRR